MRLVPEVRDHVHKAGERHNSLTSVSGVNMACFEGDYRADWRYCLQLFDKN